MASQMPSLLGPYASLFSGPSATPQSALNPLAGLLGGSAGGAQQPSMQAPSQLLQAGQPTYLPSGAQPEMQGGGQRPPWQPWTNPVNPSPVPNFSALAQIRQSLGMPAQQQQGNPMGNLMLQQALMRNMGTS